MRTLLLAVLVLAITAISGALVIATVGSHAPAALGDRGPLGLGLTAAGLLLLVLPQFFAYAANRLVAHPEVSRLTVTLSVIGLCNVATGAATVAWTMQPVDVPAAEPLAAPEAAIAPINVEPGETVLTDEAPPPDAPMDAAAVFAARADSVVVVRVRHAIPEGDPRAELLKLLGASAIDGHGSAFAVEGGGLLITNYHVIKDATHAEIRLRDGRAVAPVSIVAVDLANDLALLQVAEPLVPIPLADRPPVTGARAWAIGSPLGFDHSLSEGIVSAVRDLRGTAALQFDASIAPGSSGGPLLDDRGRVIGVTSATSGNGIGLAVDVALVRALLALPRTAPKALAILPVDLRLVSIEGGGGPVDRMRVEPILARIAAKADACSPTLPEHAKIAIVTAKGRALEGPKITTNLGAEADTCLNDSLRALGLYLALAFDGDASRVSATFDTLAQRPGDTRAAEARTLDVQINAAP